MRYGEVMAGTTRGGRAAVQVHPVGTGSEISTEKLQQIVATCPAPDYAALRAELDALFGADRIGDE